MKPSQKIASLLGAGVLTALLAWPALMGPTQAAATSSQAKVVANSLNVRSEPSLQSSVVATLKYGTAVTVVSEDSHGWVKIKYQQASGWVAGYYLQKGPAGTADSPAPAPAPTASASQRTGIVAADALRMRKGPGLEHDILHVLALGTQVEILKKQADWLQTRTADGKTGWVSSLYIREGTASRAVSSRSHAGGLRGKVIVIDPGHGGSDVGTLGTKWGTEEKTLNHKTSLLLASKLRQRGAQVIMTRTADSEKPSLAQRVAISEAKAADAFVSIHYNSSTKPNSGTLTFFYAQNKDYDLARSIESRLAGGIGLKSNGLSFGNYHVLRENDRPSVLVELGFLSNPKDEALVRTAAYQEKAAQAIADGLADYFGS
ncbi:N-acetylmuramoyl-L-alanine amidase [Brevibacillus sp. SAFN-007a]|uniref:N-acetylmuramoyl-L-alanine amidase n=1 Tax=Brevibacillus sp. SAFN-007a TaxID=3436862 RepID=UPI003F7F541E